MQAAILAAGRGTRMGDLTRTTPKPMLCVSGKPLLAHKIDAMPREIDEVVILIGYLGDQIQEYFNESYGGRKITYVSIDNYVAGTGMGLWAMREAMQDKFLVLMGDDIYSGDDMRKCLEHDWAIVVKRANGTERGDRIVLDENGQLTGFTRSDEYIESQGGGLIFTGLYMLKKEIFNYPLQMTAKNEYGLPQTLLQAVPDIDLAIIPTDFWISITSPDDLPKAESLLKKQNII